MDARLTHSGTAKLEIRAYLLGAGAYRLGAVHIDLTLVHADSVKVRTDLAPVSLMKLNQVTTQEGEKECPGLRLARRR